MGQNMIMANP